MTDTQVIHFSPELSKDLYGIRLRSAEVSLKYPSHLVFVRYTKHGVPQEEGLRLDLGKQVFLDHFEDEEVEDAVQKMAPRIAQYVALMTRPERLTV